ncbi:MAG: hypothetical protein ACK5NY_11170 [Burkholderiaceae bacterium]|jgi:hypothetical protein
MKISRRGTSADFGESNIELNSPTFTWDSTDSCITVRQSSIRDFLTDSRHNYTLRLSLPEIQSLLQAVADAAISAPHKFEKELEQSIKPLLRIQAAVAGLVG